MGQITIEIPDGKRAEWINGVLTLIDEAPKNITERIKTLDDAIAELGDNHKLVKQYFASVEENDDNIVAYQKLRIIAAALNEGWNPRFANDEYCWISWFKLYTQEEIDYMDDDEKQELVRFGGDASSGSPCGLGYSYSSYAFSVSNAYYCSCLAVKSEELAEYFGKQFIHIWKNFLIDE